MRGNIYNNYRAQRFDEIVGQQELVRNIHNQSKLNAFFHAYLLVGWYGSGKTTVARLIAMAANCEHKDAEGNPCGECPTCKAIRAGICGDVMEIDAATNSGAENIRSLKETLPYAPLSAKKKVIIIDEVHMLSTAAFNALLKIVEEAPEHVIFIFATTEQEKVLQTIRSRCFTYTFGKIPTRLIADHVKKVAAAEEIDITDGACNLIARSSDGAMRNALKLLEQVGSVPGQITEDTVSSVIGGTDSGKLAELLTAIIRCDRRETLNIVEEFSDMGKNLSVLTSELLTAVSDTVRMRCGKEVCAAEDYIERLSRLDAPLNLLFTLMPLMQEAKTAVKEDASEAVLIAKLFGLISEIERTQKVRREESKEEEQPEAEETTWVSEEEDVYEPTAEEYAPDIPECSARGHLAPEPEPEPEPEGTMIELEDAFDDPFALLGSSEENFPAESSQPEEEDDPECPAILKETDGMTEKAKSGMEILRHISKEYPSAKMALENGCEYAKCDPDGVELGISDLLAEETLRVFIERYNAGDLIRFSK